MEVLVLGAVEARLAGASVDLGTPKQRALLCALALSLGRPVAVDTIVDLLKASGIDIARRTVAKYREAMNIPSSVQRRREKRAVARSGA